MLELLLCSLFTILPDYLYRHHVQGKRLGHELTFYSVWFELRWGIVSCLMLAITLITVVFYYHPSADTVFVPFRTVPIVPEVNGRVADIYVRGSEHVAAGQGLFRLDDTSQQAAVETARRAVAEIDAARAMAEADLASADAKVLEAQGALRQAADEFATQSKLDRSSPGVVAHRQVEKLEVLVQTRIATVAAAKASRAAVAARLSDQLPAQRASAEAALAQADAELAKTIIRAGVSGRVEQFLLQRGDIVNPFMRPAGVLVPDDLGLRRSALVAGFPQIEASVLHPGMVAEASCVSMPWKVIPMVVTSVQGYIATGQLRGTDQLLDASQFAAPGTVLVTLEPLYQGGLDGVTPGGICIANAYSSHHEQLQNSDTGLLQGLALHAIDTVGLVHAILLRIQVLLLPFKMLVLSGGH